MSGETAPDRTVIAVGGADAESFLQGLLTNDVTRAKDGLIYAALLTPQGKYLSDFFALHDGARFLIDAPAAQAAALAQRLGMYRLRADVTIEATDLPVARGLGAPPEGAHPDPRDPSLGWRAIGMAGGAEPSATDWAALRVAALVPEAGIELIPNETFALEAGLDRLGAVDFRKGCYVGQEVTARMKHKTELRKGLTRVAVAGEAPAGTEITAGDRPAGVLYTQSGGAGIAYLRFDRAGGDMTAGDAQVSWPGHAD